MTWFKINERILELERKGWLTEEEVKEWNTLIKTKKAGILKRNEKNYRKTDKEERGEKEAEGTDAISLHGYLVET